MDATQGATPSRRARPSYDAGARASTRNKVMPDGICNGAAGFGSAAGSRGERLQERTSATGWPAFCTHVDGGMMSWPRLVRLDLRAAPSATSR
jgi:hypothetical protein